jgi:hypothetical protein
MYNYRLSRANEENQPAPPAFVPWYARQRRNQISTFLLTRYFELGVHKVYLLSSADRLAFLEERLARFRFVGSYKHADTLIAGVSAALGIGQESRRENVINQRYLKGDDLTDALRETIIRENILDAVLYARWADRGFRDEAPKSDTAPDLPRNDRLTQLTGDLWAELRKKPLFRALDRLRDF